MRAQLNACFLAVLVSKAALTLARPNALPSTIGTISPNGLCGVQSSFTCVGSGFGDCCSQWGNCGSTDAYCGEGCNPGFGSCSGDVQTTDTLSPSSSTPSSSSSFAPASSARSSFKSSAAEDITSSQTTAEPSRSSVSLATQALTSTFRQSLPPSRSSSSSPAATAKPATTGSFSSSAAAAASAIIPLPTANLSAANGTCAIPDKNATDDSFFHLFPPKGCTLQQEIQCYSLPYGAIGFVSHILTYYTITMIAFGRSPWTWRHTSSPRLDMTLAAIGLIATVAVSVIVIVRCHDRWQFSLIATWKLMLSCTLGAIATHAANVVRKYDRENLVHVLWWLILYFCGMSVGLVGLLALVHETWEIRDVRIITYVFIGVWILSCATLSIIFDVADVSKEIGATLVVVLVSCIVTLIYAALYSDWILGAVAGNLVGVPSADNMILYWAYFAAKRLTFFSL